MHASTPKISALTSSAGTSSTNILLAAVAASAAFSGCVAEHPNPGDSSEDVTQSSKVSFNLDLPNSDSTDSIELELQCPDISQSHTLDVTGGAATGAFFLPPGACVATMTATTASGETCEGSMQFTVVAGQITPVTTTLLCRGEGSESNSGATIGAAFEFSDCSADRILEIYAIPGNLELGQSTIVEIETTGAVVGTPTITFDEMTDADNTANLSLTPATSCAAGSAACQVATCDALGAAQAIDPDTFLLTDHAYVTVRVEDDECFDRERILIECASTTTCGNGIVEGTEGCDDGNLDDFDGCSGLCQPEVCGDGIVQPPEVCDGEAGVGGGEECALDCMSIIVPIECGDGIVQPPEECDDGNRSNDDGCSSMCLEEYCGDGIVQAGEECDNPAFLGCMNCIWVDPNQCIACVTSETTIGLAAFYDANCAPNQACDDVFTCMLETECWAANGIPAECYCGEGVSAGDCADPSYVPVGECAAEITAGAGEDDPDNTTILQRFFNAAYPLGIASLILNEVPTTECTTFCGL